MSKSMTVVEMLSDGLALAWLLAAGITGLLLGKSLRDFTRAGPQIRTEVLAHFRLYTAYAVVRLAFWAWVLSGGILSLGILWYSSLLIITDWTYYQVAAAASAITWFAVLTALQFCRQLLYVPSSITASYQYRFSRLYPLWHRLTPERLRFATALVISVGGTVALAALARLASQMRLSELALLILGLSIPIGLIAWATWSPSIRPATTKPRRNGRGLNLVMLGSDTLRADRLGLENYHRRLTPNLDELGKHGYFLSNCYVPLARTAPSLASLLTGTWPHHHGIRDNYVADEETDLPVTSIADVLAQNGYQTRAIADWAGADLGKIRFGFQQTDTPEDQWNLKYYLRQGPMDLRLFVSLFTHNRFGKALLPELYYLAGVPLTRELGEAACQFINESARSSQPFFLNLFSATTHVPFGCEYPYYTMFSDRDYTGESKFVMTKLADPMEIIQKQEADNSVFDVPQILNLYDSCVRRFDDEVERIYRHLRDCGLMENTVIVVYSDHGSDFFENHTWGQGNTVLGPDPSARVPVLILTPRETKGRRLDTITRSVDIAPTLLEFLGLPIPAEMDGVSLAAALKGEVDPPDLPAFQETGIWLGNIPGMDPEHLRYPNLLDLLEIRDKRTGTLSIKQAFAEPILMAKDRMIRRGRWKLVYQPLRTGGSFRLFDVETDPSCTNDLSQRHPEIAQSLREELMHWMCEDGQRKWIGGHCVAVLAHGSNH